MLLVPYSPETHHLIGRDVIAAMKPTAFLINLARGGVVDEAALIEPYRPARSPAPASTCSRKHAAAAGQSAVADAERHHHAEHRRPQRQIPRADDAVLEPNLQAFTEGRLKDMRNVIPHKPLSRS